MSYSRSPDSYPYRINPLTGDRAFILQSSCYNISIVDGCDQVPAKFLNGHVAYLYVENIQPDQYPAYQASLVSIRLDLSYYDVGALSEKPLMQYVRITSRPDVDSEPIRIDNSEWRKAILELSVAPPRYNIHPGDEPRGSYSFRCKVNNVVTLAKVLQAIHESGVKRFLYRMSPEGPEDTYIGCRDLMIQIMRVLVVSDPTLRLEPEVEVIRDPCLPSPYTRTTQREMHSIWDACRHNPYGRWIGGDLKTMQGRFYEGDGPEGPHTYQREEFTEEEPPPRTDDWEA
ncbi:hypothetical protein F4780DRAFT_34298 [Xylariomycetidae sp. FL0641]|nr:hypothetical protein F4780DRAFT_34298 [Xylariomycetidae sp. FL0641]